MSSFSKIRVLTISRHGRLPLVNSVGFPRYTPMTQVTQMLISTSMCSLSEVKPFQEVIILRRCIRDLFDIRHSKSESDESIPMCFTVVF
jgi:hypothetical protein